MIYQALAMEQTPKLLHFDQMVQKNVILNLQVVPSILKLYQPPSVRLSDIIRQQVQSMLLL